MKSISITTFLSVAMLFIMGCKPISGVLDIKKPVTLKIIETVQDDDPFCDINPEDCTYSDIERDLDITVRRMNAKLDVKSKKKMNLILSDLENEPKVVFNVPSDFKVPERNGEFDLSSEQVGQPYDVHGLVETEVTDSREQRGWESCTYYEQRRVCRQEPPQCNTNRRGERVCRPGRRVCRWEQVPVRGQQEVEYFYRQTDTDYFIDLLQPNDDSQAAQFKARKSSNEKIYTYRGRCY